MGLTVKLDDVYKQKNVNMIITLRIYVPEERRKNLRPQVSYLMGRFTSSQI